MMTKDSKTKVIKDLLQKSTINDIDLQFAQYKLQIYQNVVNGILNSVETMDRVGTPMETRLKLILEDLGAIEIATAIMDSNMEMAITSMDAQTLIHPTASLYMDGKIEVDNLPTMEGGDVIACPLCGETHKTFYGERLKDGKMVKDSMVIAIYCPESEMNVFLSLFI
jgi:hypothetical protein